MKQCIKCGRKGIFLNLYNDRICKNCIETGIHKRKAWGGEVLMSRNKILGNYKKADSQLNRMWDAIYQANDGNYEYAIEVYRKIIFDEKLGFIGDAHLMRLIDFCYKSEKYNDAWKYLQEYKTMYPHLIYKIINYEVKILKKENRYVEAIRFLPRLFIYDINGFFADEFNNKTKFEKDAKVILKKTTSKEIEANIQYLEYLISNFINDREYNISVLDKSITNFIKETKLS